LDWTAFLEFRMRPQWKIYKKLWIELSLFVRACIDLMG